MPRVLIPRLCLRPRAGVRERAQAIDMPTVLKSGATLGADPGYDTREFVDLLRYLDVTPHVARNLKRPGGSPIDDKITRHAD